MFSKSPSLPNLKKKNSTGNFSWNDASERPAALLYIGVKYRQFCKMLHLMMIFCVVITFQRAVS